MATSYLTSLSRCKNFGGVTPLKEMARNRRLRAKAREEEAVNPLET